MNASWFELNEHYPKSKSTFSIIKLFKRQKLSASFINFETFVFFENFQNRLAFILIVVNCCRLCGCSQRMAFSIETIVSGLVCVCADIWGGWRWVELNKREQSLWMAHHNFRKWQTRKATILIHCVCSDEFGICENDSFVLSGQLDQMAVRLNGILFDDSLRHFNWCSNWVPFGCSSGHLEWLFRRQFVWNLPCFVQFILFWSDSTVSPRASLSQSNFHRFNLLAFLTVFDPRHSNNLNQSFETISDPLNQWIIDECPTVLWRLPIEPLRISVIFHWDVSTISWSVAEF